MRYLPYEDKNVLKRFAMRCGEPFYSHTRGLWHGFCRAMPNLFAIGLSAVAGVLLILQSGAPKLSLSGGYMLDSVAMPLVSLETAFTDEVLPEIADSFVSIDSISTSPYPSVMLGCPGVVITGDGYILTAVAAINTNAEITVELSSGARYTAYCAGTDAESGLAILKIDAEGLTQILINDEDAEDGDRVWNVWTNRSIDSGVLAERGLIVSDSGRLAGSLNCRLTDYGRMQSGFTGGALVNGQGRLVGLCVSQMPDGSIAASSTTISEIADRIIYLDKHGEKLYIGFTGYGISESEAASFGVAGGIFVEEVDADSPAGKAGLLHGDIIVSIGNANVRNYAQYVNAISHYAAGDLIKMHIVRGGVPDTLYVRPSAQS